MGRGSTYVSLDTSYKASDEVFTSGGDLTSGVAPLGQKYLDVTAQFDVAYGLSDRFTLHMHLPFLYRQEENVYNSTHYGLGDAAVGVRYLFTKKTHFSLAGDVTAKFPTGDTGTVGFAGSIKPKIPLGTGNTDVTTRMLFQQSVSTFFAIEESVGFKWRSKALVDYLTTTPLLVGNLTIDWGDEILGDLFMRFNVSKRWSIRAGGHYLKRFSTDVDSFTINTDTNGAITSSTPANISLGQSSYAAAKLNVSYVCANDWMIQASWVHPVWGKSYPLASLAFVESMIGETFSLGIRRVF